MIASATSEAAPRTPDQWWTRMGLGKRIVLGIVAMVVGINVTLWGIQAVTGGADPGGPVSSSFATGDDGIAAWADLLELRGRTVSQRERPLSDTPVDPNATLVVADPDELSDADLVAVETFLSGGGRLVAVGAFAATLAGPKVQWDPAGVDRATVRGESGGDARSLVGSGEGSFSGQLAPGVEILASDGSTVVATETILGEGAVIALADSGVVHNERLARGDNAAFALAIVGGDERPVVFLESVHGFGVSTGLGALPDTAKWVLAGLVLAGLVGMWCAGQRFGPPEDRSRTFPPPRTAYVKAMAVALERSGDRVAAVEPLRQWTRRVTAGGTGSVDAILTPEELSSIESASGSDSDLLAVGRVAARLRTGGAGDGPWRGTDPAGTADGTIRSPQSVEGQPR